MVNAEIKQTESKIIFDEIGEYLLSLLNNPEKLEQENYGRQS